MKRESKQTHTQHTVLRLHEAIERIVLSLPLKKRRELGPEIEVLCSHLGVTKDLLVDQRALLWKEGGKGKATIERKRLTKPPKPQKEKSQNYKVTWRGSEAETVCTLDEAAQFTRLSPAALRSFVSLNGGQKSFNIDDEVVTVSKLQPQS